MEAMWRRAVARLSLLAILPSPAGAGFFGLRLITDFNYQVRSAIPSYSLADPKGIVCARRDATIRLLIILVHEIA